MPEVQAVATLNLPWSLKKFDGYYIVLDSTGSQVCAKMFMANPDKPDEPYWPDASQMEYLVVAVNSTENHNG